MTTNSERERDVISSVATLYYLKCPFSTNHYDTHPKTKKVLSIHRREKKKKKICKTISEEAQTLDFLDKDFKSDHINMFKKLRSHPKNQSKL